MGVHGLTGFIEDNRDLLINEYPLRATPLVIDAFNLMNQLAQIGQEGDRTDLFGGDMVRFGSCLNAFYDNLEACEIFPILVMDGAQTFEASKSKVEEKLRRSRERFQTVMKINEGGFGSYIFPNTANIIFKSVAVDRGIKIFQSFFEADMEVARLAGEYKCPVLSGDSDFFLYDLPYGLITIKNFNWSDVKNITRGVEMDSNWRQSKPKIQSDKPEFFISCRLYKQENFNNYLLNFNVKCLPLLGPLLGNDFVETETFARVCDNLPARLPQEFPNPYMRKLLRASTFQQEKIVKILCFCCDKTPEQVINQLSMNLPKDKRSEFKKTIKSSMKVYSPPTEDTYEAELRKIYEEGFRTTYAKRLTKEEMDARLDESIRQLAVWLINCAEKSVMTHKILELLNKNVIFQRPHMDDLSLPAASNCRYRVYSVILRLLRPFTASKKPVEIYNRVGTSYEKSLLQQLHFLDKFGRINYLAYDVPTLSPVTRRDLVLATFHHNHETFVKGLIECDLWFDPKHGDEFMSLWMIMDYIDIESPEAKLSRHFRQATLLCLVYYLCIRQPDRNFTDRLEKINNLEFTTGLKESIHVKSLDQIPFLGETRLYGSRKYECRIMHHISQLHNSIESFNLLNAFLGDPLTRLRAEYWLNSCLIYNLTEAFRKGVMKVPRMPDIIGRAMSSFSPGQATSE